MTTAAEGTVGGWRLFDYNGRVCAVDRFTISSLYEGPADLEAQLPVTGVIFDARTGPDNQTYLCAQLDQPIRYHVDERSELGTLIQPGRVESDSGGSYVVIHEVVIRPSAQGAEANGGRRRVAVELAYAIDSGYIINGQLDFRRLLPVAAAEIEGPPLGASPDTGTNTGLQPPARGAQSVRVESRPLAEPMSPAADDGYAGLSTSYRNHRHGPPPLQEFGERRRRPKRNRVITASLVAAAIVGLGGWLLPGSDNAEEHADVAGVTDASTTQADIQHIEAMLPGGYSSQSCMPTGGVSSPSVTCGPNSEPGGPQTAIYSVEPDERTLDHAFTQATAKFGRVNCPGNIQSPGPWRRNAAPDVPAGTLFCGIRDGQAPVIVWTDQERLLLNVVHGGSEGPGLDQLYAWWSTHS